LQPVHEPVPTVLARLIVALTAKYSLVGSRSVDAPNGIETVKAARAVLGPATPAVNVFVMSDASPSDQSRHTTSPAFAVVFAPNELGRHPVPAVKFHHAGNVAVEDTMLMVAVRLAAAGTSEGGMKEATTRLVPPQAPQLKTLFD
jgi:hypothetical protein